MSDKDQFVRQAAGHQLWWLKSMQQSAAMHIKTSGLSKGSLDTASASHGRLSVERARQMVEEASQREAATQRALLAAQREMEELRQAARESEAAQQQSQLGSTGAGGAAGRRGVAFEETAGRQQPADIQGQRKGAVDMLKQQILQMQGDFAKLQAQNEMLAHQLQEPSIPAPVADEVEVHRLRASCSALEAEREVLVRQIEDISQELRERLEQDGAERDSLQAELSRLKSEYALLEEDHDFLVAEAEELCSKHAALLQVGAVEGIDSRRPKVGSLMGRIRQLQVVGNLGKPMPIKEDEEEDGPTKQELKAQVEKHAEELNNFSKEVERLRLQNTTMAEERVRLEQEALQHKDLADKRSNSMFELQRELETMEGDAAHHMGRIDQLVKERDVLHLQLEQATAQTNTTRELDILSKEGSATEELSSLRIEFRCLQEERDLLLQAQDDYVAQLEKHKALVEQYSEECKSLRTRLGKSEDCVQEHTSAREQLQQTLEELRGERSALAAEHDSVQAALQDHASRADRFQRERDQLQTELEQLSNEYAQENSDHMAASRDMQAELEQARSAEKQLATSNAKLQAEVERHREFVVQSSSDRERLQQEVAKIRNEHETLLAEHDSRLGDEDHKAHAEKLAKDLEAMKAQMEKLREDCAKATNDHQVGRLERDLLKGEFEKMQVELAAKYEDQRAAVELDLTKAREENRMLTAKVSEQDAIRAELDQFREEHAMLERELVVQRTRGTRDMPREDDEARQKEIEKLAGERTRLQLELSDLMGKYTEALQQHEVDIQKERQLRAADADELRAEIARVQVNLLANQRSLDSSPAISNVGEDRLGSDRRLPELEQEVEILRGEREILEAKCAAMNEEMQIQLELACSAHMDEVRLLHQEKAVIMEQNAQLSQDLQQERDLMAAEADELRCRHASMQVEHNHLKMQAKDTESLVERHANDLQQALRSNDHLMEDNQRLSDEVERLRVKVSTLDDAGRGAADQAHMQVAELEELRRQAQRHVAERKALENQVAKLTYSGEALARENEDLRQVFQSHDGPADVGMDELLETPEGALAAAEKWALSRSHTPLDDDSDQVSYLGRVVVCYKDFQSLFLPLATVNAVHRPRLAQLIESGELARSSLMMLQEHCQGQVPMLDWKSSAVCDFVFTVFREAQLSPPTEDEIYQVYCSFDTQRAGRLNALECVCLVDSLIRIMFRSVPAADGGDQALYQPPEVHSPEALEARMKWQLNEAERAAEQVLAASAHFAGGVSGGKIHATIAGVAANAKQLLQSPQGTDSGGTPCTGHLGTRTLRSTVGPCGVASGIAISSVAGAVLKPPTVAVSPPPSMQQVSVAWPQTRPTKPQAALPQDAVSLHSVRGMPSEPLASPGSECHTPAVPQQPTSQAQMPKQQQVLPNGIPKGANAHVIKVRRYYSTTDSSNTVNPAAVTNTSAARPAESLRFRSGPHLLAPTVTQHRVMAKAPSRPMSAGTVPVR